MAEISFDEIKQVIGDLYLELWTAKRDLERQRAASAQLLEATRPQAQADAPATQDVAEEGPTSLPLTAIRRKEG